MPKKEQEEVDDGRGLQVPPVLAGVCHPDGPEHLWCLVLPASTPSPYEATASVEIKDEQKGTYNTNLEQELDPLAAKDHREQSPGAEVKDHAPGSCQEPPCVRLLFRRRRMAPENGLRQPGHPAAENPDGLQRLKSHL